MFLIFCIKFGDHKWWKLTRPDFFWKLLNLRKMAKSPKKWGFWYFLENRWPCVVSSQVQNVYCCLSGRPAKTRSKNIHFPGRFRVLTAVNMWKKTFLLFLWSLWSIYWLVSVHLIISDHFVKIGILSQCQIFVKIAKSGKKQDFFNFYENWWLKVTFWVENSKI